MTVNATDKTCGPALPLRTTYIPQGPGGHTTASGSAATSARSTRRTKVGDSAGTPRGVTTPSITTSCNVSRCPGMPANIWRTTRARSTRSSLNSRR